MNPAWRFYKGNCPGAETGNFDDRSWTVVSLPHGIEYLPTEASAVSITKAKSGIANTLHRMRIER